MPCRVRDTRTVTVDTCPSCGRPHDLHDRHVRFTLPEPVLDTSERETLPGMWMSHANARESVMMQVPNIGAFVRALLPIRLTEGHTITFGVWLAVEPRELQSIFAVWWAPEYRDLRLTGWLANAIPPWGLLAAPVEAGVRDPEETPYCDRSSDPGLDRVLRDGWPHDVVLTAAGQA
jgi:hypothetical protein